LADLDLVLANDMLVKTDRMSMMHSLEVRPPLLDNRVVDLALTFPDSFKAGPTYSKKILREAFRDELPPQIFSRNKRGFEVPLKRWFLGSFRATIEREYTDPDFLRQQGIFNPIAVSHLWKKLEEPQAGDSPWWLWSLIVFQHWYKKHIP
jgi:asparagine synthase (glutamine-hydrolysing)